MTEDLKPSYGLSIIQPLRLPASPDVGRNERSALKPASATSVIVVPPMPDGNTK